MLTLIFAELTEAERCATATDFVTNDLSHAQLLMMDVRAITADTSVLLGAQIMSQI